MKVAVTATLTTVGLFGLELNIEKCRLLGVLVNGADTPIRGSFRRAQQRIRPLLFDQFRELVEKVGRVMGARRGFGMILHAEDR